MLSTGKVPYITQRGNSAACFENINETKSLHGSLNCSFSHFFRYPPISVVHILINILAGLLIRKKTMQNNGL